AERLDAEAFGEADEVVVVDLARGLPAQRGALELRDLGELAVAEHDCDDGDLVLYGGQQLEAGHEERAVAGQRDDGRVRAGELRADRGGDGVAHARVVDGREEPARPVETEVLDREERPVPAVGRAGRLAPEPPLGSAPAAARGY